ncbi:MAG: hypothetical protein HYR62_05260 [Actinobacteria bacterium]|nr:hypothetical protein [Actinomycetota bacterium]MBI3688450.1 hypothetical protein [Actinomycetota bacterium]
MAGKSVNAKTHETSMLVSELASDHQGSLSPFGDVTFPLPADRVRYEHPREQDRPHLAALDAAGEAEGHPGGPGGRSDRD